VTKGKQQTAGGHSTYKSSKLQSDLSLWTSFLVTCLQRKTILTPNG